MKYTVGIDLGGTNIAAGICDEELNIIAKASVPTLAKRDPELIVKDMAELTKGLIADNGIALADIKYVGIAAPGSIDPKGGIVKHSNNIVMSNFPMRDIFKKHCDIDKVYMANDANAAALAEALVGSAKGADVAVMVTLGTGVGGGIIIGGRIFDGGLNSFGAEIGHTVIVSGGNQCTCGRRGCWEAYSSATALTRMTEDKINSLLADGTESVMLDEYKKIGRYSARIPFIAMKAGDEHGAAVCNEYIKYLAEGLTNIVNIFQPHVICLGGGVCNEKEYLTAPLTRIVNDEQYTKSNDVKTKIVIATLGNDAGIIGAASLGL